MKYKVFQAKAAAENAARKIYGDAMQSRAEEMQGLLHDWNNGRAKMEVKNLPPGQLQDGNRFPLYGRNAASQALEKEQGHTKAWAMPVKINDGRWVFPSPDDTGVPAEDDWWPEPDTTE
jgi:uridine kinase